MTKRITFHICPSCGRHFTAAEVIERWCQECRATVEPKLVRGVAA